MSTIGTLFGLLILIGVAAYLLIEWQYRQRPGNELELTAGEWNLDTYEPEHYAILLDTIFTNRTRTLEIFISEVNVECELLSKAKLDGITIKTEFVPQHEDFAARADNYWFAYIVKTGKATNAKLKVDITGPDLSQLKSLWVQVHYMTYGPEGRIPKTGHFIFPLKFPKPEDATNWRENSVAHILPVPTHLLTNLDSTVMKLLSTTSSPVPNPAILSPLAKRLSPLCKAACVTLIRSNLAGWQSASATTSCRPLAWPQPAECRP